MNERIPSLKKITFLIRENEEESLRYRVLNVIEGLLQRGIECNIGFPLEPDLFIENYINKTDILIVFRMAYSDKVKKIIDRFKAQNIPVVFDVDDLIFEPELVNYIKGITGLKKELRDIEIAKLMEYRKVFDECDYITCSTSCLAERAKNLGKKSYIVKNTINKSQYLLSQKLIEAKESQQINDKTIKIGYFSGSLSHQKDFNECSEALLQILTENTSTELHIVGYLTLSEKFSAFKDRIFRNGFCSYLDMLVKLSQMDINIAPLQLNNPFVDCKSELKIFESALVLVPTVASATDSYSKCIKDEINGFLASTNFEWYKKLSLLVKNPKTRNKIAKSARTDFLEQFYINNTVQDIIRNYEEIISYHCKKKETGIYTECNINAEEALLKFCKNNHLDCQNRNLQNFELVSLFYNPNIYRIFFRNSMVKERVHKFIEQNRNKRICFYGAGRFSEDFVSSFDLSKLNIIGFMDRDPEKAGKKLEIYTIYSPDDIKNINPDTVVITMLKPYYAIEYLEQLKAETKRDFEIVSDLLC